MGKADFARVLDEMRLAGGSVFPIPITLPVSADDSIRLDAEITLRDSRNNILAILRVEELFPWDRRETAERILGTTDLRHPLVAEMHRWGDWNVSGRLAVLQLPPRYDFRDLRLTPEQTRRRLEEAGHANVVAFQTRNPLHRVLKS
jgi:sulfate adenylyltransferase